MGSLSRPAGAHRGIALATLATALLSGCDYLLRSPDRPASAIHYQWEAGAFASNRCLLVLLPGFFDDARSFERQGLVHELHRIAPACDQVAVDLHLYDYRDGSAVARVHDDVIEVARARGYQRVWLVGISMGALGAILTAREHPESVDGLVLISPYLGTQSFLDRLGREVRLAGGVRPWADDREGDSPGDSLARILHDPRPAWRWLAGYRTRPDDMPPMWLAYGRGDPFAELELLEMVTPERVLVIEGRHDWETWRRICRDALADVPVDAEMPPSADPGDDERQRDGSWAASGRSQRRW